MNVRKIGAAAMVVALVVVILWFAGVFRTDGIAPGRLQESSAAVPERVVKAVRKQVADSYIAVGTIRPRTETRIEAQVSGKVRRVMVKAGDVVSRGEVLVVLDDRKLKAQRDQAAAGLASAHAAKNQALQATSEADAAFVEAKAQYRRIHQLFSKNAVSRQEMDRAEAAYRKARARLEQARDAVSGARASIQNAEQRLEEAEIALGYAEIQAPEDMEVARRMVEPGDLAMPGKPLLIVQTAGSLILEANVREGLVGAVRPGEEFTVQIHSLDKQVTGVVEEIIPSGDPATRTFLVKVGLPDVMGAHPGMFGRLVIPTGMRTRIEVPREAVRHVGQLSTVLLIENGKAETVYVKTGQVVGDMVEIVSGLSGGEVLGVRDVW